MKQYTKIFLAVTSILLMATAAMATTEDIIINPSNQNPIEVQIGVPLNVYPPLNVTLIDWAVNNAAIYEISVVHDSSQFVNCSFSGPIISDPQIVELNGCVLNNGDKYSVYAKANCSLGNCTDSLRSKKLEVAASISPIPELITFALVGLGLVGLIGFARSRK